LLAAVLTVGVLTYLKPSLFVKLLNPEIRARIHQVSAMSEETASIDIEIQLKNKTFIPISRVFL
jgi:hypothetical protein